MLTRAAWLEWRRGGLGGSDVAAVLGLSRWSSPWDVWLAKVHGADDDRDDDQRMTGRLLEAAIGSWAALEIAKRLRRPEELPTTVSEVESLLEAGTAVVGPEDWIRGTPDFVLWWGTEDGHGIECKVAEWPFEEPEGPFEGGEGLELLGRTALPVDYEIQCRWYMLATGRPAWWIAAFARKAPAWNLYRLERDPRIEEALVNAAGAWWRRHVVNGEPPPLDASPACGRALERLHPRRKGATVADFRIATAGEVALALGYDDLDRVFRRLKTEREESRNALRRAIGDDAGLRWTGGSVRWSRNRVIVRLDQ